MNLNYLLCVLLVRYFHQRILRNNKNKTRNKCRLLAREKPLQGENPETLLFSESASNEIQRPDP